MRVPTHFQDVAKTLALRGWVKKTEFPRDKYFETIDDVKKVLIRHADPEGDTQNNEAIVVVLAAMLDHEGVLATYVLDLPSYASIGADPETRWANACRATGWVVLQAYELACNTGKWPK